MHVGTVEEAPNAIRCGGCTVWPAVKGARTATGSRAHAIARANAADRWIATKP